MTVYGSFEPKLGLPYAFISCAVWMSMIDPEHLLRKLI
jgi:hypothetical protein